MKKHRKNHTARIPARAAAETRHLSARSGLEVLLYQLLQSTLVQKERRNDLPELTPQRARELYEAWRRGEMADVQLMWDQLEERDETLFTVLHARLGALAEMPWAVNIDADLAEDIQPLAESQKRLANELLAAVENLPEALVHLGMADFRGVAALEIVGDLRGTIDDLRMGKNGEPALASESEADATPAPLRWEVIEPWNLCRPVRRGPWYYNAEASATPTRPEELEAERVILREAQPIDLPAMFLICAKYLSVHAWDAFLEVFGIPNIFLEMPPATPQDKAMEFDAVVQRLIGEGRGTVPNGAKFHTVETSKDNTQSFEARAKWCNEAIIQLATGGLLTVTTQSGSGTLAGNAHSDSFSRLCAASARSISAAINRQFLRPALQAAFAGQPVLVKFELAPEPVDDRKQMAELLAALNAAGWAPAAETVSEMMNFEVQRIQQPPTDTNTQAPPVMNRSGELQPARESTIDELRSTNSNNAARRADEERETTTVNDADPPLNAEELATLRFLGGGLNPGQVGADAEYTAAALREGLVMNSCNQYGHDADCDGADDDAAAEERERREAEEDERREREMDASSMESAGYTPEEIERVTGIKEDLRLTNDDLRLENSAATPQDEEDVVTNASCNQHQHATGCMRFAVLKKGGRSSRGNPKNKRNKTSIPAILPPNATAGQLERRLYKDMENASGHKGNQITKRGKETYITTQKSMDHSKKHADEYKRTHQDSEGKYTQSKINARGAKILAQAEFDKDGDDAIAYDNGIKVIKHKNGRKGATKLTSVYPEKKYRKQTK